MKAVNLEGPPRASRKEAIKELGFVLLELMLSTWVCVT